jgi:hypothetical protein
MGFNWKVFFVVLPFSLAIGAFLNIHLYLLRLDLGPELYSYAMLYIDVVGFVISPLFLFASFYLMGRNIDLIAEFPSILMSLFLGSWIGHLTGYFSSVLLFISLYGGLLFSLYGYLYYFWIAVSMALSLNFFVGFAALSISYIVKKRQTR